MHPIIRIICFILLVIGLAIGKWLLYFSCLPLLVLFWRYAHWLPLQRLLKRLRWLFISLFILHLWFHGSDLNWIPSQAGLLIAIEKIFILILMVSAAHLLLVTTVTNDLIAAIHWWFKPLDRIGFKTQILAIRLALTLETLNHVHALYQQQTTSNRIQPITQISERVTQLFQTVARHAEQAPLSQLTLPQLTNPPIWQWLYPFGLIAIMVIS